jgi:hypothetical protein
MRQSRRWSSGPTLITCAAPLISAPFQCISLSRYDAGI